MISRSARRDFLHLSPGELARAVRSGDMAAAAPEPQTFALLLAGLGLLWWRRRLR